MTHKSLVSKIIKSDWLGITGILAICFFSHLPHLLNPGLIIDNDECVLGIMAQRALEHHELPFYFIGQAYGFAWIETIAAALAFKAWGVSFVSLESAMLILWAIGSCFYYRAMAILTNRAYGFMVIVLLVLSPAWMSWSMKARGGYITAFLLTSIIFYWWVKKEKSLKRWEFFCLGALCYLNLISQANFSILTFILSAYFLWKNKSMGALLSYLSGLLTLFTFSKFMLLFEFNYNYWHPDIFGGHKDHSILGIIKHIPGALCQVCSAPFSHGFVLVLIFLLIVGSILQLFLLASRKGDPLAAILFLCVLTLIVLSTFLNPHGYTVRYLLALSVFSILWLGVLYFDWWQKHPVFKAIFIILFSILFTFGSIALSHELSLKGMTYEQKVRGLISFLDQHHIKYVYCLDDYNFWELLFLSDQQIIPRWKKCWDRMPQYPLEADRALIIGQPVVLVVAIDKLNMIQKIIGNDKFLIFENNYIIIFSPSKELIFEKLKFLKP